MCRSCANSLDKSLDYCPIRCKLGSGQTACLKQVVLSFGAYPLSELSDTGGSGVAPSQGLHLIDESGHTGTQTTLRLLEDFAGSDPELILEQANAGASSHRSLIFSRAARAISLIGERIAPEYSVQKANLIFYLSIQS